MLNTMVDEDKVSQDKSPSPELISLVNEWAESYIKSTELPLKILEMAEKEGLNKQQIREIVEDVLLKRGLSERRIREVLPAELKDQTKIHPKPAAAESAAKSKPNDEPPKDPDPEPEDEEPTPLELAQIEIQQLKDVIKKTEQFKPATELQVEVKPFKETGFEFLREMADGIHSFYYDTYGIDLFRNRELSQLKNSGVKVFRRLYFEV